MFNSVPKEVLYKFLQNKDYKLKDPEHIKIYNNLIKMEKDQRSKEK